MKIAKDQIAEILTESKTAEEFATYAACRERNVREGISRLSAIQAQMAKEGFRPVPSDLMEMFRGLDRIGVGKLQGDMFKWHLPIRRVGEAVAAPAIKDTRQYMAEIHEEAPKRKTLVICFGPNKEASIEYSSDLTKQDLEFLCNRLLKQVE